MSDKMTETRLVKDGLVAIQFESAVGDFMAHEVIANDAAGSRLVGFTVDHKDAVLLANASETLAALTMVLNEWEKNMIAIDFRGQAPAWVKAADEAVKKNRAAR